MNSQPVLMKSVPASEVHSSEQTQLRGPWLITARATWLVICLSTVGLLITALVWNTAAWWNTTEATCYDPALGGPDPQACVAFLRAHVQVFGSFHLAAIFYGMGAAIEMLPWVLVGALIFWRKSDKLFPLLFSLGLVLTGALIVDPVVVNVIREHFPNFKLLIAPLGFLADALLVLWYRFPNGRFVPRGMRWLAGVWISLAFLGHFLSGSMLDYDTWPQSLPQILRTIFTLSLVASLVYRYRRISDPVERQQIRWVVTTGAVYGSLFAPSFLIWHWTSNDPLLTVILHVTYVPLLYISSAVFAAGIGIAILRHKLWNIDVLINRTLVYGLLTASVVGIYVIVVGILGTTIQGRSNFLVSILATGLVAVLVQPLRDHLQRGVNRMMYGERDDPVTVLSRLGQRLEATLAPDAVLPSLVETVAQTLKLPYVAIEAIDQQHLSPSADDSASIVVSAPPIAYGQPQPDAIHLPLIYQSETIGQLVVAPRASSETLSPMDRHLLENIAYQAGMAVHAVNLTMDLQRSRQRLVTAREEERRRLRRDLHDGLGPNLASQGLKLAAIRQMLEKDPVSAGALLDQVMAQNQSTVEEVRRLVYGLRPPALDELGLVAAIRDYVAGMDGKLTLRIEIIQPVDGLPPLSAAVEVAAYRIVLEALTNVIRHAQAHRCAIRFSMVQNGLSKTLQIEIQDDGIGLPRELRAGVGLRSMRERAEELDGKLIVDSRPGATCLLAIMPIGETIARANPVTETPGQHSA